MTSKYSKSYQQAKVLLRIITQKHLSRKTRNLKYFISKSSESRFPAKEHTCTEIADSQIAPPQENELEINIYNRKWPVKSFHISNSRLTETSVSFNDILQRKHFWIHVFHFQYLLHKTYYIKIDGWNQFNWVSVEMLPWHNIVRASGIWLNIEKHKRWMQGKSLIKYNKVILKIFAPSLSFSSISQTE